MRLLILGKDRLAEMPLQEVGVNGTGYLLANLGSLKQARVRCATIGTQQDQSISRRRAEDTMMTGPTAMTLLLAAALALPSTLFEDAGRTHDGRLSDSPQRNQRQPQSLRVVVGSGRLDGTVVDATSRRPVADVRVTIEPVGAASGPRAAQVMSRLTVTDSRGQFTFPRLPAGDFSVSARHGEFIDARFGQNRPGGSASIVALPEGGHETISVTMWRGATISGLISSDNGTGLGQIQIRAMRISGGGSEERIEQFGGATDERGVYRLSRLPPGRYLVSATMSTVAAAEHRTVADALALERAIAALGTAPTRHVLPSTDVYIPTYASDVTSGVEFLPTFYPGTIHPSQATTVYLSEGEERPDINLQLRTAPGASILGTVVWPDGAAGAADVVLLPHDRLAGTSSSRFVRSDSTGSFAVSGLAAGAYTISASAVGSSDGWAQADLTTYGQSESSVRLVLQPGRTVSGVALVESHLPDDQDSPTLTLAPLGSSGEFATTRSVTCEISSNGRFVLEGVGPGLYTIRASYGQLKSALLEGRDILDFPLLVTGTRDIENLVVTFADNSSRLFGWLRYSDGKPGPEHTIVVASTDQRYWIPMSRRVAVTRPNSAGYYSIAGLPPGDYMVAAVFAPDREPFGPDDLASLLESSIRVTIPVDGQVPQSFQLQRRSR